MKVHIYISRLFKLEDGLQPKVMHENHKTHSQYFIFITWSGYCLRTIISMHPVSPPSGNKESSVSGKACAWRCSPSLASHRARRVEFAWKRSISEFGAWFHNKAGIKNNVFFELINNESLTCARVRVRVRVSPTRTTCACVRACTCVCKEVLVAKLILKYESVYCGIYVVLQLCNSIQQKHQNWTEPTLFQCGNTCWKETLIIIITYILTG